MLKAVDIAQALDKLVFLEGRSKSTTVAEEDAAFATLAAYRNGAVFAGSFSGESPWERHPNGDELVHVLSGETTLTIMAGDGPQEFVMRQGMLIVVPRGHWHRFRSAAGVTVLTVTPQPTEHSDADIPCE